MPPNDPVLLRYVGPPVTGAPARNLRRSDLERIAYRRRLAESASDGVRPSSVSNADVNAAIAELTARGRYKPMKSKES